MKPMHLVRRFFRALRPGRPMMYGTSKEFLIQFGLKDLTELPSIEDFQDLAGGEQ